MSYVIGVDLGTSAVKTVLVNREGKVAFEASEAYPLHQPKAGYSEQNPEDWVEQTIVSLRKLLEVSGVQPSEIEGLSFSGQMHGLVLVDAEGNHCAMPFCGMIHVRRLSAAALRKYWTINY